MRDVHERLRGMRHRRTPLEAVARDSRAHRRVLCLDELYVSDIADAMILGALFEALLRHGVRLVITSNLAPADLYQDGLQRSRFLPTIALLERELEQCSAGRRHGLSIAPAAARAHLPGQQRQRQ